MDSSQANDVELYSKYLGDIDALNSGKYGIADSMIYHMLYPNSSIADKEAILLQTFSKPMTSDMSLTDLTLLHLLSMHAKDWALDILRLLNDVLLAA